MRLAAGYRHADAVAVGVAGDDGCRPVTGGNGRGYSLGHVDLYAIVVDAYFLVCYHVYPLDRNDHSRSPCP